MTLPRTISQRGVARRSHQAHVGAPSRGDWQQKIRTGINKSPQAKKVITVTVTDPGDETDIDYAIEDITLTTNTGTGADAAAIAILMAADINGSAGARALVTATTSGDDVILTANYPGVDFDFDFDAALSEALTTAADAADAIAFGVGVVRLGILASTQPVAQNEVNESMALAKSALLTAQVDELALTYDAAVVAYVGIEIDGATYLASHAQATDADTSIIALADLINAIMPANTVIASHPTADTLTLTAEVAGKPFKVTFGFGSVADTGAWVHTSNAGIDTDINRALAGISMRAYDEETTAVAGASAEYPPNAGVKVLESGVMPVENTQGVSWGDPVYLELAGASTGKFYNTSSATRVKLERAMWLRSLRDDMAELEYDFAQF